MDGSHTPTDAPSDADGPSHERRAVLDELCALLERAAGRFRDAPDGAALARLERIAEAVRGHLLALRILHEETRRVRSRDPEAGPGAVPADRDSPPAPARPAPVEELPLPPEDLPPPADGLAGPDGGGAGAMAPAGSREARARDGGRTERFPPFRDQRTGLHSREGFDAVASGELKRCRRHERVFSLLLLQLPARREEPLRRAALALRRHLRESDLTGRHVERTLAAALPETSVEQARLVCRRLVTALEGAGAWDEDGRIGIATYPADGDTLLSLLDTARGQLALPARVVLYPPSPGA